MCLAVPGIIRSIADGFAQVDFGGVERQIALDLLPDAQVGEYILAHAGFALQKLDVVEAEELLALFKEIEEASRMESTN